MIILKTLSVGSIEALSGQIVDLLDNLIIHSIQHLSDLLLVTRLCVTLVFLRLFLLDILGCTTEIPITLQSLILIVLERVAW